MIYDKRRLLDSKKQCGAAVDSELASVLLRKRPKDKLPPLDGLEGFLPNEAAAPQVTPSQMGPRTVSLWSRVWTDRAMRLPGLVDKALRAEEEASGGRAF